MTPAEVQLWITRHAKLFPAFASYVRSGGDELRDVLSRILEDVTLQDATDASEELYRRPELRPRSAADHPAVVAQIARDRAAARGDVRRHVNYQRCAWGRCTMPGVASSSLGGAGPWYCRFHWACHRCGWEPTREAMLEWRRNAARHDDRGTLLELQMASEWHWMCLNGEAEPLKGTREG